MNPVTRNRVLVVDDEGIICDLLGDVLSEAGFDVACVNSGATAVAALETDPQTAALITDIRLGPGIDGWEVAARARGLNPAIHVIFITGDSADDWRSKGVPNSMVLQKPFEFSVMVSAVATLLGDGDSDGRVRG